MKDVNSDLDLSGEKLQALVGAEVSMIRFGYGVDLILYGGKDRDRKYAEFSIAADFELKSETEQYAIKPYSTNVEELAPVLRLLRTKVVKLTYEDEVISLAIDNGFRFTVEPHPKFEAWTLTGDGLGFYLASPL